MTGTSLAAPQAAGLAEYLWSIAPDLNAPQIAYAMIDTGAPPLPIDGGSCGTDVPSAPRLDAYGAVLSLDQAAAVTPAGAPVRLAILDPDGAGGFEADDIEAFVNAHAAPSGARDWSRFDANGDGFTGVPGPPRWTSTRVARRAAGAPVLERIGATLDEHNVTDTQGLCYYAYSGLYSGSLPRRTELLPLERCGDLQLEHNFPQRVRAGDGNTLTIDLSSREILDASGSPLGRDGAHLRAHALGRDRGRPSRGHQRRRRVHDDRHAGRGTEPADDRGPGFRPPGRHAARRGHRDRAAGARRDRCHRRLLRAHIGARRQGGRLRRRRPGGLHRQLVDERVRRRRWRLRERNCKRHAHPGRGHAPLRRVWAPGRELGLE